MDVNGDKGHTARRTQAERSQATRAALVAAARDLFARKGYAGTGREEIVEAAGVTRGALYHHFANKEDVFRAVYEALEEEIVSRIVGAAVHTADPLDQLRVGAHAYLDAALDPAVQRVVLIDGPAVLPWDVRQEIVECHGLGLVRATLAALMDAGVVDRQPLEPLAHVVLAALHEAALYVARAADGDTARREVGVIVDRLIAGL